MIEPKFSLNISMAASVIVGLDNVTFLSHKWFLRGKIISEIELKLIGHFTSNVQLDVCTFERQK